EIDMKSGNRQEAESQDARRPRTSINRFVRRNKSGWSKVPLRSLAPGTSVGKPNLEIVLALCKAARQFCASSLSQLLSSRRIGFIYFEPDKTELLPGANLLPAVAARQTLVRGRIGSIEVSSPNDLAAIREAVSVVGANKPTAPVPVAMGIQYLRVA